MKFAFHAFLEEEKRWRGGGAGKGISERRKKIMIVRTERKNWIVVELS